MNLSDITLILIAGMGIICIPIAVQMKWYGIAPWKSVVVAVAMVITGLFSCKLWFFLENGYWKGKSFYGAIFFAPLTFLAVARGLRIRYTHALDFCASAGCLIFAILKVECLLTGCCRGIPLYIDENHVYVCFPSAIVEFATALILAMLLLFASKKVKNRGKIYPLTMVSYGTLRFFLNLLRDDWGRAKEMGLPMPIGNFWSLAAILIGAVWLALLARKRPAAEEDHTTDCQSSRQETADCKK